MGKNWVYRISCFSLVLISFNAKAVSDVDINAIKGKDILYSSPFEDGSKAIKLNSYDIQLSEDFVDDGNIIIHQKAYPIDQLFVKNADGVYENLAYLLNYDGITNTYFIRYYDRERLAIKDEIKKMRQNVDNCVGSYDGKGTNFIAKETLQYSVCLDNIFYRIVDLFYTQSKEQLLKNYKEQSDLWQKFYFDFAHPDNCYGRCGTVAQMQAYGKIIDVKKRFIIDLLDNSVLLPE